MINQNLEILNKIFFTEPQMLVEKYNEIDEATKKYVEIKITNLKDDELQEYLIKNQNKLLDIVTLFVSYNLQLKSIDIHKVK